MLAMPDVFDLADDGKIVLLTEEVPGHRTAGLEAAVRDCPAGVITTG